MHGEEVDTKDLHAVCRAVAEIYGDLFGEREKDFVPTAFAWAADAFAGKFDDFQRIDAKYHDLEHTMQGTLALARLLRGYVRAQGQPELTQRAFELGMLAILLHDTGYLKRREDTEGTGAKYTLIHVGRSADFAAMLLGDKGFHRDEIRSVQNMIRCTGLNADLLSIPFATELERKVGYALGTSDLLGQMAAPDYTEKLGILYLEFEESNRFSGKPEGTGIFKSAEDLRSRTPQFWYNYVLPKIEKDFQGMFRYLNRPDGSNPYLKRIEENIGRLQRELNKAAL